MARLITAFLVSALTVGLATPAVAADPGPTRGDTTFDSGREVGITGVECDIKLSLVGGPETDGELTVREWEDFLVHGYGFPPDVTAWIEFERADAAATFETVTDSGGAFTEGFYFESDELSGWSVWAWAEPMNLCQAGGTTIRVIAGTPFTDVEGQLFEREIAWLYQSGITGGCTSTEFCRLGFVTRGQMAAFLTRALALPAATADYFDDDDGSIFEGDINRLAESGITGGCAERRFCATANVTREQMASFLVRAFALPATTADFFTDDETSVHEADINRLAADGITGGCTADRYCPAAPVTREQMAAFLYRAFQ